MTNDGSSEEDVNTGNHSGYLDLAPDKHDGYLGLLEPSSPPPTTATAVPNQFNFVIPGKLAGMAKFDGNAKDDHTLREKYAKYLKEQGITTVISIEKDGHKRTKRIVESVDIKWYSCFLPDWHAPSVEQLHEYNQLVGDIIKEGGAVATHCWGGTGRTSCFLASHLLYSKIANSAQDAFKQIREKFETHSIEMKVQYNTLARYSDFLGNAPSLPFSNKDIDFSKGEWNGKHGDDGIGSDPGHKGAKAQNYEESKVNKVVVSEDGAKVRQGPYIQPIRAQHAQTQSINILRKNKARISGHGVANEIRKAERRLRMIKQEERQLSEHIKHLRSRPKGTRRLSVSKTSTDTSS
eukprot:CAMPEP_0194200718 /NCGR_PEP_ID=MMETSP0156-20130528/1201_1 /TAXON_ID=33649 /ORGANISM="Thalassionema nitzschioides, Strain L26-B" /LENGTH=349 /DNA_ID=CAMNT_0038925751 /DNA_START=61 /DNA_END=1107 /DNA_ORIENTATION=+